MTATSPILSARKKEIFQQYIAELDKYVLDLKEGKTDKVMEVREFAQLLHIHPSHLSNTIKEVSGKSSCSFFEARLLDVAKELLLTTNRPIADIAMQLTYDPSNFTKFFKHFTGTTPKKFRNENLSNL